MAMVYDAKEMKKIVVSTLLDSGTIASQIEVVVYAGKNTETVFERKSHGHDATEATDAQ
jgi:hypothetical protein